LATGFPSDHDASPELLVYSTGVFPALVVEAFTGTQLQLLRQLDDKWHEVQVNLVSKGQRGMMYYRCDGSSIEGWWQVGGWWCGTSAGRVAYE
jgi:hypothetical protein